MISLALLGYVRRRKGSLSCWYGSCRFLGSCGMRFWTIFIKYLFPNGIKTIETNKNQLSTQWDDTLKKVPQSWLSSLSLLLTITTLGMTCRNVVLSFRYAFPPRWTIARWKLGDGVFNLPLSHVMWTSV